MLKIKVVQGEQILSIDYKTIYVKISWYRCNIIFPHYILSILISIFCISASKLMFLLAIFLPRKLDVLFWMRHEKP